MAYTVNKAHINILIKLASKKLNILISVIRRQKYRYVPKTTLVSSRSC